MDATIANKKSEYIIINHWINFLQTRELTLRKNLQAVLNGFHIIYFSDIIIKKTKFVNN